MKSFIIGIKNLISWFPLIWKLRNYDYSYGIELFKKYLFDLANHLDSDKSYEVSSKNDAKRIRTTIKLMDKVYNEDYGMEYIKTMESIYGREEFYTRPLKSNPKLCSLEIRFVDIVYSEDELRYIDKQRSKLIDESNKKQEKAHRILWKLIEQNIQKWWD